MKPWLTIVGIGEDGPDGLSRAAREALASARTLVGGERHLALVEDNGARRIAWASPIAGTIEEICAARPRPVCVLATGDPMWFGIGGAFARHVPAGEMRVLPAPSAWSLAAARLGWPLDEVTPVSLHGRPGAAIERFIHPGARLMVLSEDGRTPGVLAARLTARGMGPSQMTVLEHLGGPREQVRTVAAEAFDLADVAALNMVAIDCHAGADPVIRAPVPGLADDAFSHDGQLTKREVRAVTLARLMPLPGALLWDIGAGSGSIAIEWMRAAPWARAIAIEQRAERAATIARNAEALGVPDLRIVEGVAPGALHALAVPDAVFIGGGIGGAGGEQTVRHALDTLAPGGRLVANAVTLAGEAALVALQARHGGELARIAVAHAGPVGAHLGWRTLMPVTQWAWQKAWGRRGAAP
jgi:precorrin-6Y C5,15-methyltransferase (decarboxylating)